MPTVERNLNGSLVITDTDRQGYLVTRVYYGYTRKEALAMFRQDLRERNREYTGR